MSAPCSGCKDKTVPSENSKVSECVNAPSFDSVFIADGNIVKTSEKEYKISFSNVSNIILYQIWDDTNKTSNDQRVIVGSNVGTWVDLFTQQKHFEPTVIMAQPPKKWAFVLKNVEYSNCKMTWLVSTKLIDNTSTTVSKGLITGKFKNLRFDIGAVTYVKNPCPPVRDEPLYDQIIIGDVEVKKVSDKNYTITFQKEGEITFYQIWPEGNNPRKIFNTSASYWVNNFILEQVFQPTTVMEVGKCRWAFVIKNAEFTNNKMIWSVSTKEITNLSTAVTNGLKTGKLKNARFDVDSISSGTKYCFNSPSTWPGSCSLPPGYPFYNLILNKIQFTYNNTTIPYYFKLNTNNTITINSNSNVIDGVTYGLQIFGFSNNEGPNVLYSGGDPGTSSSSYTLNYVSSGTYAGQYEGFCNSEYIVNIPFYVDFSQLSQLSIPCPKKN